jgi:hypothetical protein
VTQENNTSSNDALDIIPHCVYGRCTGTRKMNDTRSETMHRGKMDRDFTADESMDISVTLVVWWLVCLPLDPKVTSSNLAKAMDF